MALDPEAAEVARKRRAWRLNVRGYPVLRLWGYAILVTLAAAHMRFLQADPDWAGLRLAAGVFAVYCLASWWLLGRYYERVTAFDLQLVPLHLDVLSYTWIVWLTGAGQSWLYFLLISRVADQTNTTFRRVLYFAHLGPLCYAAMLLLAGQTLDVKVLILYVFGLYWSATARTAESLRRQTTDAVHMARDLIVSLRLQAEELEAARARAESASEAKSAFLAAMTHELRTPLHAVLGFAQILQDPDERLTPEETRRYLGHIQTSGSHLLALINDVLDLVRVESGRLEVHPETLHVEDVLEEMQGTFEAQARARDLDFSVRAPAGGALLHTDARRLKQILLNLLGNALEFTPSGGRVELRAACVDGRLRFEVADTGPGIPPELHEKVFEEFFQVGRTPGRAQKGTGLGLALTRRLVQLLGGSIRLESAVGEGTTLVVELPAGPGAAAGAPLADPGDTPHPGQDALVLIVEDNALNMELLERFLAREGYRVARAPDGRAGLEEARRLQPQVILMDLQLPDLDGLEVTRRLKADPATRGIPVVAVTARGLKGEEDQARSAGCDDFLPKPVDRRKLARCLRRVLD